MKASHLISMATTIFMSVGSNSFATTNWSGLQGYTGAAPNGVEAEWAWAHGITGQGVIMADVEYAWTPNHEDLDSNRIRTILPTTSASQAYHGTAVLGEVFATQNNYGVTGIAYGADSVYLFGEMLNQSVAEARAQTIDTATKYLRTGDIMIAELQSSGGGPGDVDLPVWQAIQRATQKGIVVVEVGGNGSQNLDGTTFAEYRSRGDNGAIIVGASDSSSLTAANLSSYGTRINLQGWGTKVYTLGWNNDLGGATPQTEYTKSFDGTSSATPIVAGAATLVQSWYKSKTGKTLNSIQMRDLLVATGTPQTGTRHIGPRPNVKAAIEKLALDNGIVITPNLTSATYFPLQIQQVSNQGFMLSTPKNADWRLFSLQGELLTSGLLNKGIGQWGMYLRQGLYLLQVQGSSQMLLIQ